DAVSLGDLRSNEQLESAISLALSGVFVIASASHAGEPIELLARYAGARRDPWRIATAAAAVLTQRLVRLNCTECRVATELPPKLLEALGVPTHATPEARRGKGCASCQGTGLRGRTAIAELLEVDEELRARLAEPTSPAELRAIAQKRTALTLRS